MVELKFWSKGIMMQALRRIQAQAAGEEEGAGLRVHQAQPVKSASLQLAAGKFYQPQKVRGGSRMKLL